MNGWEDMIHTHTHTHTLKIKYYSALKRTIFAICSNMGGLDGIILRERSPTEKDKYCMLSLKCGT